MVFVFHFFFFFKQKTAYEMRISDWSSDVCSSDLHNPFIIKDYCHNGDIRSGFSSLTIEYSASLALIPRHEIPAERDRDTAVARVEAIRGHIGLAIGDPLDTREAAGRDAAGSEELPGHPGGLDRPGPIVGPSPPRKGPPDGGT